MTPTTLGHYRLESRIGAGGMGEVYRAQDTRLNRLVAVKLWRRGGADAPTHGPNLLREARAASALNHPNIVIVHELGETPEGDQYIVQEFIEGRTLRQLAADGLTLTQMTDIAAQVSRALGAAHAAGVVHRDIKPENIMVRADGYVKVLDFGIAHVYERPGESTTHTDLETMSNKLMGTPSYLSPEQALQRSVGPAADIFALGVVLYEMATGQRPFTGASTIAIVASIASDAPVPIGRVTPGMPVALDDLVQAMLDKTPERRPTAADVEAALATLATPAGSRVARATDASATVGRDTQLAQLRAAYDRARDGRSVVCAITGEPGIGKTSLLDEFLADLAASGERPTVARGRCSESLAGNEAYLPVLEALDGLRSRSGGSSFDALMRSVAPTWYMQISTATMTAPNGEMREAIPAASQDRMKRELAALLHDVSRRVPLVWFIDDLHWADVSTIDILSYLASHFEGMRVLIVTCFRPSDMALAKHPFLTIRNDLQSRGHYEEISLSFLSRADIARYLALQFPGHRFPDSLAQEIHARTEGSPLFMVDLVRYLRDTGHIVPTDGVWEVSSAVSSAPQELPESVRGMIARKIERVEEADRRLLLAASVQGQEFDSYVLSEVLELDAADVEERLETLERVHVLVRRGDELEYPDRTLTLKYRFVHVLYQNVLYGSLQPSRRAGLCAKTAKALAAHHGADAAGAAGRIAILFETARDFASAARYFFIAAQRAVALFGFREALSLAERGLDGLRGLPAGPERHQLELGLQMIRGLALRSVKGWAAPELETTFARARQICQELADPPQLFPVLWNLAFFNMIRGNLATVQEQLVTLTAQAQAADESAFLMSANHVAGVTCEFIGDVQEASRLLEHARELHDPGRHQTYNAMFGIDPGMVARAMSSRPLWARGYPDQALARSLETIALGRSQRQPVTFVFALIVSQGIRLYRGEATEAIGLGDDIIALCREYEFPQEAEWARAFQGAALARVGRADDAARQLQDSLAALKALRSGLVRTMFLSLCAEALWRAGHIDAGLAVVDEGFAHAEATLEQGFLHELNRVRGELLRESGRKTEAEACFRIAVDLAKARGARSFELRAATALARLLIAAGRAKEGRAVLAPVYDWFTEGLGTADLVTARTLLSEMG